MKNPYEIYAQQIDDQINIPYERDMVIYNTLLHSINSYTGIPEKERTTAQYLAAKELVGYASNTYPIKFHPSNFNIRNPIKEAVSTTIRMALMSSVNGKNKTTFYSYFSNTPTPLSRPWYRDDLHLNHPDIPDSIPVCSVTPQGDVTLDPQNRLTKFIVK